MARLKSSSASYERAIRRMAALQSIDPDFDLGNGLTRAAYQAKIEKTKTSLDAYNTSLSVADENRNTLDVDEEELDDMSERMLVGVAAKHGKDSSEYEQAGGTRKSDKKKPVAKKKKDA